MIGERHHARVQRHLIDGLYVEAMLLADEARSYFDESGRGERDLLSPIARVSFSCESLKVTTRLMHVIAWLLTQRAVLGGELSPVQAMEPSRRLGEAPVSADDALASLPEPARHLIATSMDLHRRVARLDEAQTLPAPTSSPARVMQERLALAF